MPLSRAPVAVAPFSGCNVIRNGDMSIAQRGNAAPTPPNYGVDGWLIDRVGGTFSVIRGIAAVGQGAGVDGASYYLDCTPSGQSAAGDYAMIQHRIEGVRTLAGKQVTLSFYSFASPAAKIGIEIEQNFGTGGGPSATVLTTIGAINVAAGGKYSVTFTIPSIALKTLGTNSNDSFVLIFGLVPVQPLPQGLLILVSKHLTFTLLMYNLNLVLLLHHLSG